jgi:hypothetical protein
VNSSEMLERAETGSYQAAPELESGDDERRIRRAMRMKPKLSARTTRWTLPATIVGEAALLAGGVCLGWKAFRFWHE